jgi:hypothetical protein
VTGFARKGVVKYNPVVFTYGRWLNSDNLVVALKAPSAVREQHSARSVSIISKLRP